MSEYAKPKPVKPMERKKSSTVHFDKPKPQKPQKDNKEPYTAPKDLINKKQYENLT